MPRAYQTCLPIMLWASGMHNSPVMTLGSRVFGLRHHPGIQHRRFYTLVSQQLQDCSDVVTTLQQLICERVEGCVVARTIGQLEVGFHLEITRNA